MTDAEIIERAIKENGAENLEGARLACVQWIREWRLKQLNAAITNLLEWENK